ncbi:hypothetical protein [Thalassospira sp. CH_XMU1420-2]|mgnify:FL=1|uniref:hypothetical protein n=1 Tax=Thalassospira sp. CH_XMU1420-2 TaxID=3107769 RepID=UPI00300AE5C8|tara:strand:+ start:9219 stop:9710 length:492 start_codon:yes stop_codon:yes gene_type:complete
MIVLSYSHADFGPTNNVDQFSMFDSFDAAQEGFRQAIADGASCAVLSIPYEGTEPQWTDDGINLDNLLEIAQCLWESAVEASAGPLQDFRSRRGAAELRSFLRDRKVLLACEEGWKIAQRDAGFSDSFDWDFCPWFSRECFEFSDGVVALCNDWRDRCAAMAA